MATAARNPPSQREEPQNVEHELRPEDRIADRSSGRNDQSVESLRGRRTTSAFTARVPSRDEGCEGAWRAGSEREAGSDDRPGRGRQPRGDGSSASLGTMG